MRISTSYGLAGTKTFRRSSKKILGKWGSNLQNVEKSVREIFQPDGLSKELEAKCLVWLEYGDTSIFTEQELAMLRVLIQVDQSGAEALIVAYDCEPLDYRKLFIHNVKPHVYVALKLFPDIWKLKSQQNNLPIEHKDIDELLNTPIEKLKSNPCWKELDLLIKESDNWHLTERYYYFAKQTVHSANYSIEWATFILNVLEKSGGKVVLLKEQGQYFLQTYRYLFPEIPARCQRIEQQARETRMLYNMHGFPYTITDYEIVSNKLKELYAWGPQSTVAEITRIAFSKLQEYIELEGKSWDILLDCHDSYVVQCPLLDVKDCSDKMKHFMNQKLISPIDGASFNMKSECQIGFNLAPMKKNNKLGLREINW